MYNRLDILQHILLYDVAAVTYLNNKHQSPIALARFHCNKECIDYLSKHFIKPKTIPSDELKER